MEHKAIHFPGRQRFEIKSGPGDPAVLTYHTRGEAIVFDHTFVPAALRGQGIAAVLTHSAVLEARRLGWKIIPDCSYTDTFVRKHPEFAPLLA